MNWSDLHERLSRAGPEMEGGGETKLVTVVDFQMWRSLARST